MIKPGESAKKKKREVGFMAPRILAEPLHSCKGTANLFAGIRGTSKCDAFAVQQT